MKDNKDEEKTLFQAIDAVDDKFFDGNIERYGKEKEPKPQTAIKI